MKVDTEVMAALSASRTDGNKLFITSGQLDRNLYARLDKVLKAAGGKWNTKAKAHLFADDAADAIENIILTGEIAVPKDLGFFPTPGPVVDRLLELAQLGKGMSALEPSAGRGAIARALAIAGLEVDCVELLPYNANHLEQLPFRSVRCADFLSIEPEPIYDRVVMNPPFDKKRSDIHHVLHALKFLRPRGLLVAIMPTGVIFREDALSRDFRGIVSARSGNIVNLPDASFKTSGTMVNTCVAIISA
ncbi:class I SAM-dependent methyltransferase [Pseudomonas capeferrum]|uniref:class I SAM-dependent methyltransferase n=1 Tax=Pseudomonas capeferrum TaxID=1495066 RepID=UPI0015E380B6|nr:class I SAM-dependent methyltransferase [Pseudomonas capeferrum]MBA1200506.1 class I SAM-dependent methyltransferase [Pseudomonas capeferrum]